MSYIAVKVGKRRRTEFTYRESHLAEQTARITFLIDGAFLIGHTVIGRIDQILRGALDTNDRENTERNKQHIGIVVAIQSPRDRRCDPRRNFIAGAGAAAMTPRLRNAHGQKNRVDDLNDRRGNISGVIIGVSDIARPNRRITAINAYITDTAVQRAFLPRQYRRTPDFCQVPYRPQDPP